MIFFHLVIVAAAMAAVAESAVFTYQLKTLAGSGIEGNTFGGKAVDAKLTSPYSAWSDSNGIVYLTDPYHHVVRKVLAGTVGTTNLVEFAGTGSTTYTSAEEGADPKTANFNRPRGVWGDNLGNVFVADTVNFRVRIITNSGTKIFTLAGTGVQGHSDGSALTSRLNSPFAGFYDPSTGISYVADIHGCVVRTISSNNINTAQLGTLFGVYRTCVSSQYNNPTAGAGVTIGKPYAIWGDGNGHLYIPEVNDGRIQKYNLNTNEISTFRSALSEPTGVWGDSDGNIFYSERGSGGAVKVIPSGSSASDTPTTLPLPSGVVGPRGIWGDTTGNIYVPDNKKHQVHFIAHVEAQSTGTGSVVVGGTTYDQSAPFTGDGQLVSEVNIAGTFWIWVDNNKNIFLSMPNRHIVARVDAITNIIRIVAGIPATPGYTTGATARESKLNYPVAIWGDNNDKLYIPDQGNRRVRIVQLSTNIISDWAGSGYGGNISPSNNFAGAPGSIDFSGPVSIWGNAGGDIFIADSSALFKYTTSSSLVSLVAGNPAASGFAFNSNPLNIKFSSSQLGGDSNGNLFLADTTNKIIWKISSTGVASIIAGDINSLIPNSVTCSEGNTNPLCLELALPVGLWVDNSGNVYITSFYISSPVRYAGIFRLKQPNYDTFELVYNPAGNPFGIFGDDDYLYAALNFGVDVHSLTSRRRLEAISNTSPLSLKSYLRGSQQQS